MFRHFNLSSRRVKPFTEAKILSANYLKEKSRTTRRRHSIRF